MSKSAAILGLVAVASAGAPAYGSSAAPAYSSAAPAYGSSSSYAWPVSSAAPSYPASSGPAYYASSSWVISAVPSSSYPSYPSASASAVIPSQPPYPACWSACFEEAGVTSEDDLCGNTEVDKCIHDSCCLAESNAYWSWYDSYCPAPSSSYVIPYSTVPVGPYSSSAVPSSPAGNCWSACFAEYDVTSEASLCGNDDVSACIHDTCSCALDKAYWDWYDSYCVAETTTVYTVTTVYTPTVTPYSPVTTTYEYTTGYGWSPAPSAPASGLPSPYGGWSSAAAAVPGYSTPGAAAPTGYAAPSASAWAPVPATGSGSVTKPGFFLAAAMAVAALF